MKFNVRESKFKKMKGGILKTAALVNLFISAGSIAALMLTVDEIAFLLDENAQVEAERDYAIRRLSENDSKVETLRKYPQNMIKSRYMQKLEEIKHSLGVVSLNENAMINLVLITMHAETKGDYKQSLVHGNDYGITQINKKTYYDTFINYLNFPKQKELRDKLISLTPKYAGNDPTHEELKSDAYSYAFSAVHYKRRGVKIKNPKDISELCYIWKKHYNTDLGMGSVKSCINGFPHEMLL